MTMMKSSMIMQYAENTNDILFATFADNVKIDLTQAIEIVIHRLEFTNHKKHYLIIDVSRVREITTEAKEYLQCADTGLKNIMGAAFIADNPVAVLFANIFIKTPMDFKARLFDDPERAFKWIKEYKQQTRPVTDR